MKLCSSFHGPALTSDLPYIKEEGESSSDHPTDMINGILEEGEIGGMESSSIPTMSAGISADIEMNGECCI